MTTVTIPEMKAFSRNPNLLFCEREGGCHRHHLPSVRQRQPVQYDAAMGLCLRVDLGRFRAGQRIHAASVDWVRGTVRLFDSNQDLMNQVPSYCSMGENVLVAVEAEESEVYVREAFAFLLRGHSLFHPQCRCAPTVWQQRERAAHLGLDMGDMLRREDSGERVTRFGRGCPAGSSGSMRSLREFETELGVRCLSGGVWLYLPDTVDRHYYAAGQPNDSDSNHKRRRKRAPVQLPLLQILIELAGLTPVRDAEQTIVGLSSPLCCIPHPIRSGLDVETAARVLFPRPYVFSPGAHDAVERVVIQQTLTRLMQQRRIRMLRADVEGGWAIFWNGSAMHLEPEGLLLSRDVNHARADRALPPLCLVAAEEEAQARASEAEHATRVCVWTSQAPRGRKPSLVF
jgi:hypothetical protein